MRDENQVVYEDSIWVALPIFIWARILLHGTRLQVWNADCKQHGQQHARLDRSGAKNHGKAINDSISVNHLIFDC